MASTLSFYNFLSVPSQSHLYTVKNGGIPFSSTSMPLLQRPRPSLLLRLSRNAPFSLTSDRKPTFTTSRNVKVHASLPNPPSSSSSTTNHVVLRSVLTIALAVGNRVLYKLALVPMKNHPFFLAQFTTFG